MLMACVGVLRTYSVQEGCRESVEGVGECWKRLASTKGVCARIVSMYVMSTEQEGRWEVLRMWARSAEDV